MKTQEQIEKALKQYQSMQEDSQRKMMFAEDFMRASSFMDNKELYIKTIQEYHQAELVNYACEKLIKNCKWILDIE